MEHICEIIFNLSQWLRRCHFMMFLILGSDGYLVRPSETIKAIVAEGLRSTYV